MSRRSETFKESEWDKARAISAIVGGFGQPEMGDDGCIHYTVESHDKILNFGKLSRVCEALGCKPDELHFNADKRSNGGCETCHEDYEVLEFWVVPTNA